jgi:DNA polymerase-3 subunit delta
MPEITEKELLAQLKKSEFSRAYLIYGSESYLKRFYTDRIVKKAVTAMEDFNLHRFDGSVDMDTLASAVETLPMMSEHACTVVCDYNCGSVSESEHNKLKAVLSDLPPENILIFWYDLVDITPSKSAKSKAIFELFRKNGGVINFERKSESELAAILCRRAGKRGCSLQTTTSKYLIRLCGNDIENLFSELDKVCDYTGKTAVTEADIDAVAVKTVEASVFLLAKTISEGNRDRVYLLCDDLFASKVEPIAIIGALSGAYVDMYRAKLAESEGKRAESIAQEFGYGGMAFKLTKGSQNARKMSVSSLRRSLGVLRKADSALKSTAVDGRVIVEQTLARLLELA